MTTYERLKELELDIEVINIQISKLKWYNFLKINELIHKRHNLEMRYIMVGLIYLGSQNE